MVKFTIKFLRLFKWLFPVFGINYRSLETLVETKLTNDFRRAPSAMQTSGKKQSFFKQLIMFCFMGLFIGMSFYYIKDVMVNFTIFFSFLMVMLGTTLITEFTSVLFDERDNSIILPLPVDSRTFLASRLVHIQFYIGYIALALSLCTIIIVVIKYGFLVLLGFLLALGITSWITLLMTTLFYLALARIFNAERFKNFISYVQIIIAVLVFGSYQILPRLVDNELMNEASLDFHWYTYLFPPVWSAGFANIFFSGAPELSTIVLFFLAILAAIGGGIVAVRFLSNDFTQVLTASNESKVQHSMAKNEIGKRSRYPVWFFVSNIEKAGWDLTMITSKRDRKFKQAVYPSFGFVFIMVIVFLRPDFGDIQGSIQEMANSQKYLALLFISFFGTTSIMQLPYTDVPEAAWIYKALPISGTRHILTGAFKSMMFKFYIPFYVIITAIIFFIWGYAVLPQTILAGILVYWITQVIAVLQKMELPFTQARENQSKGSNVTRVFIAMFFMAGVIGAVYLIAKLPMWGILALCIPAMVFIPLTFRRMRRG